MPIFTRRTQCHGCRQTYRILHIATFKNSSLLIGMHPDEATDAILEYACYYQKPLAIVPCCVYAEVFTHRKIADKPVLTYENLLNYLQFYPHNPLQRISLPFSGRNIVLYNSPNEKN